jgi:hypothetical protein
MIPTDDQWQWLVGCLRVIGGEIPCLIISDTEFSGKTELLAYLCAGILSHSPVPFRVTVLCQGKRLASRFRDKTRIHAQGIDITTFEEINILFLSFHEYQSVAESDADLIIIDDADEAPPQLLATLVSKPHILTVTKGIRTVDALHIFHPRQ